MLNLSVQDDLKKVIDVVGDIAPRHIKRSVAIALTKTAVKAKNAIADEMPKVFDRPTPYTRNAMWIKAATVQNPEATIMVKDQSLAAIGAGGPRPQINWLSPEIHGGPRNKKGFELKLQAAGLLPNGYYVMPAENGVRLDAFGNVPGAVYQHILRNLEYGPKTPRNMAKAKPGSYAPKAAKYFVLSESRGKLPPGIYERRAFAQGSGMRAVFVFVKKQPVYQERLDFYQIIERTVQSEFVYQFEFAFEDAIRRFGK